jgi:hypothetical protein
MHQNALLHGWEGGVCCGVVGGQFEVTIVVEVNTETNLGYHDQMQLMLWR